MTDEYNFSKLALTGCEGKSFLCHLDVREKVGGEIMFCKRAIRFYEIVGNLEQWEFRFAAIAASACLYIGLPSSSMYFSSMTDRKLLLPKKKIYLGFYLLGQHAHFVLVLLVVSKLDLNLKSGELDRIFEPDRMGSFQDRLLCLLVQ